MKENVVTNAAKCFKFFQILIANAVISESFKGFAEISNTKAKKLSTEYH